MWCAASPPSSGPAGPAPAGQAPTTGGDAPQPLTVRAPLFWPAIAFCAGILLDFHLAPPAWSYVVAAASAGLAFAVAPRVARRWPWLDAAPVAAVLVLAAAAGGLLFHDQYRRFAADHLAWHLGREPIFAHLRGEIATTPILVDPPVPDLVPAWQRSPRTRATLQVSAVQCRDGWHAASGLVQLHIEGALPTLAQGDVVQVYARLFRTPPPDNPGEFRWDELQRRRRVLLGASVNDPAGVHVLVPAERSASLWTVLLTQFRRLAAAALYDEVVPDDQHAASLLSAMVLGQRSATDRQIETAFQRTGTTHLLSVSGFHLTFLAAVAWGLARLLTRRQVIQGFTVLLVVGSYLLLAEPTAPLIRSAVVCAVGAVALMVNRPPSGLNWLAAAALVTLTLNPGDLFAAGFQLSYASLLSLIYLGPVLHQRVFGPLARRVRPRAAFGLPAWRRALRSIARVTSQAFAISFAAALAGAVIGWYHFGAFSPYAPLNSVVLVLPVGLLLVVGYIKWMLSGVLLTVAALGLPAVVTRLQTPLAWLLERLLSLLADLVSALATLPAALLHWPPPPLWLVVAYLVVLGWWARRRRLGWNGAAALALLCLAYPVALRSGTRPPAGTAWLDVLAVGQGQAAVLRSPAGHAAALDCGSISPFDLTGATVGPYLHHEGIRELSWVLVSHSDLDHFSGVSGLAAWVRVGPLVLNEQFAASPKPAAQRLLAEWRASGGAVQTRAAGAALDLDAVQVEVLWPPRGLALDAVPTDNDTSLVTRVTHAGQRVLLCGDLTGVGQRVLLAEHAAGRLDLRADVLVLPHHGRVSPAAGAFVAAVNPRVCVRSDVTRTEWTFSGLAAVVAGRAYHNTADEGGLRIELSPAGVSVRPLVAERLAPATP